MGTQTKKVRLVTYDPRDIFSESLLYAIQELLQIHQAYNDVGVSDIQCEAIDGDIVIYGIRPETPEEEAKRIECYEKTKREELELLAQLQAKYKDLINGN
jgi:hypothetical protein